MKAAITLSAATFKDLFSIHEWKNINSAKTARKRLQKTANGKTRIFISSVKIMNMVNNAGKK